MKRTVALLISVMLLCSSVSFGVADGESQLVEEELTVEAEEVYISEEIDEVLSETIVQDEIIDDSNMDTEVLYVDDSVSLDAEEATNELGAPSLPVKQYLKIEAEKVLFSDRDFNEVQVTLAADALIIGTLEDGVYVVQYAEDGEVKPAYACVYDVVPLTEEEALSFAANVENVVTTDGYLLIPVIPAVETTEEYEENSEAVAIETLTVDENVEESIIVDDATETVSAEVESTNVNESEGGLTEDMPSEGNVNETTDSEVSEDAAVIISEETEKETVDSVETSSEEVVSDFESDEVADKVEEIQNETTQDSETAVIEGNEEVVIESVAKETDAESGEAADKVEEIQNELTQDSENAVIEGSEEISVEGLTVENETDSLEAVESAIDNPNDGKENLISEESLVEAAVENADSLSADIIAESVEILGGEAENIAELVISDEVISEEASLASSADDYIYADSAKTIIAGYKVDATGGDITIPASVKRILNGAFKGNKKITGVSFAAGALCDIETGVFQDCTSLITCALPELNNATNSVPDGLFRDCTSLEVVTIEGNNTKVIGDNAFYGCSSLYSVSLGNQIEKIGASAFEGCSALGSIALGSNVESIGSAAFRNCTNLGAYSLGNKVVTIGEAAFSGDVKLRSMTWSTSLKYIQAKAFYNCSVLGSVSIPEKVETIGASAFEGCIGLTDLRFEGSSSVPLSIYSFAFRGCTGLKDIDLPDRTANIWQGAFMNCTNVLSVSLPKTLEVIGEEAFRNNSAMTRLTFRNRDYFDGTHTLIIYSYAFTGCTSLTSAMLPARTARVEKQAFYGDKSILEVDIPGGQLVFVGESAFAGLNDNVWITIWKKGTLGQLAIGTNAFDKKGDICSYLGYDIWKYAKNNPNAPHWVPLDAYLHVQDCYHLIFGRDWTASAIANYRKLFHNDAVTGLSIVEALLKSPEFKIPNGWEWKSFLVDRVFQTMVLRTPDASGINTYTNMLKKGVSVYYLLSQIAKTQECQNKMASIGLKVGTIKLTENRDQNIEITHFVTRLYSDALNRHPDLSGLNHWTGLLLNNKATAYSVSRGFIFGKEFTSKNLSNQQRVVTFYKVYLNRTPVGGEEKHWVDLLEKGVSDLYIVRGFVQSTEFTGIAKAAGIPRGEVTLTEARDKDPRITWFAKRCYLYALNRQPDIAGLNHWCSEILNKKRTYDGVARGFLFSPEMTNRHLNNTEFLNAVYHIYFDRDPDAGGLSHWLGLLSGGATMNRVIDGFSGSKEYENTLKKLGLK